MALHMHLLAGESLRPFQYPEFRYFILARFLFVMAIRMLATVVAYRLFQITQSSFAIGLAGLSEFIPVFFLALYAGHVIDKSDKRTLLFRCILYYSGCVVALIIITSPAVSKRFLPENIKYLFFLIIFFTGVIRAFTQPSFNAIIAQLVPKNLLAYAANISSTTFLIAAVLGHAGAGFFIAWFGVNYTFYVILFFVLLSSQMINLIEKKLITMSDNNVKTWDSMKEGLLFVFQNKIMLAAFSLDLFAVLFGGAAALIPEFAEKILKVGPIGFGWLNAAMDLGAIIMIVIFTIHPLKKKQGKWLIYSVAGFGICIIVFGLSKYYWLSFVALFIAGMLDGISMLIRGAIFQLLTPDDKRGRVSSVNSMFINSSNELGQFESGVMAKLMGPAPSVVFGGCMTLLIVFFTWLKADNLRKFEY